MGQIREWPKILGLSDTISFYCIFTLYIQHEISLTYTTRIILLNSRNSSETVKWF